MAHHTLKTGFPAIPLAPGMKVVLEAINPTTDAEVAGVTSGRWMIYGRDKSPGPPLIDDVPNWIPEEQA